MTNTTRRHASAALLAALLASKAAAQDLTLPEGARLTAETVSAAASYPLPMAAWTRGTGLPVTRIEGAVTMRAYRLDGSGLTPLQIMEPLREQVTAAGYQILLDCAARACGGFDFRFATEVIPAPDMYVDLSAYRFLSAVHPDDTALTILTSRDGSAGYLQITRVGKSAETPAAVSTTPAEGPAPDRLIDTLEKQGHAILRDLVFESGAAALSPGDIASLDALAAYLRDNPDRRILFVGHTDAVGSADANRALSLRRAQAAMTYMREVRGLDGGRIDAEGAGFLAPVASNLTEAGREANRRVEAVLLPAG